MIAEILATGDELRSGSTIDTNSAYIAKILERNGIAVTRHQCVGDDVDALSSILNEISQRADICIVTGGLGPTADDLTAFVAAKVANVPLCRNEEAYQQVLHFFTSRNLFMSPLNEKQAILPQGTHILKNEEGVAPGFYIVLNKCHFFFLPGVPREMKTILNHEILAIFEEKNWIHPNRYRVETFSLFGLSEPAAQEMFADFSNRFPRCKIGYQVGLPTLKIKLYVAGDDPVTQKEAQTAEKWIHEHIKEFLFSRLDETLAETVGRLLKEKNATLSIAESCTGGLISHEITNIPGISDYFMLGVVPYSNEAKMNILNVSADALKKWGAVSEEVASEMASGVKKVGNTTYGISTTGIAGPSGGTPDKPVGTLWIGLATPKTTMALRKQFSFNDRAIHKALFAASALFLLIRELES